jgi:hypothetical protein
MNTEAIIFMALSWGSILTLAVFSYYRMFRKK